MAGRWMVLGHYKARGQEGWEALAQGIEDMVTGISSSVETDRGLAARLRYLTTSDAGYEAMDRAGIHVAPKTLMAWLAEEVTPNRANRARLDAAYWDLRRQNVAADLKRRLNNDGRGTRIEVNGVDQSSVDRRHQRDLPSRSVDIPPRSVNVRGIWDRAVDAWLAEDEHELDAIWDEILLDHFGSDRDKYSKVSSIGWSA
ncbi:MULTISPECIES: transcriptional regulator [Streptomyces]|uniref:Transcriptional regulator n=2 Tax=Streptomyces TaxID=1883 RepID=A0A7Y6CC15_9ACTN|nr:transcriptional regulator [Streptomyces odorifer]NUV30783.1 transcriptional regulator [Streptomyces odorifer]NUV45672.1 transcriptional regulator [Streptomyces sp. CAI-78]